MPHFPPPEKFPRDLHTHSLTQYLVQYFGGPDSITHQKTAPNTYVMRGPHVDPITVTAPNHKQALTLIRAEVVRRSTEAGRDVFTKPAFARNRRKF